MKPVSPLPPSGPSLEAVASTFEAARLRQARQLALLTKQDLAAAAGISAAAVGQFETGPSKPRPNTVARLAAVLDVPPAFFAAGRPYLPLESGSLFFRSLRSTSARQRNKAVAYTQQVGELAIALEKHVRFPAIDLPGFTGDETKSTVLSSDPVLAAQQLRRAWKLGTGPIPQMIRLVESKGIVTVLVPMVEAEVANIDAFSTASFGRPVLVLSPDRADDVYRHRFSAAHELGHIVLHGGHTSGTADIEREADRFAAEFLTPRSTMEQELPSRLDMNAIIRHSQAWGIEPKSLIKRSHEIGKISEVTARRGYIRLNQLKIPHEPVAWFPGEQPSLLLRALDLAEQRGLTIALLANELAWTPAHLRRVLGEIDQRPELSLVS